MIIFQYRAHFSFKNHLSKHCSKHLVNKSMLIRLAIHLNSNFRRLHHPRELFKYISFHFFIVRTCILDRDYCISAFREERNSNPEIDRPIFEANQWNLGTAFLSKYYTVLDYDTNAVFFGLKKN